MIQNLRVIDILKHKSNTSNSLENYLTGSLVKYLNLKTKLNIDDDNDVIINILYQLIYNDMLA